MVEKGVRMREQLVWFIGGPWDITYWLPYPLPDGPIRVPFATNEFYRDIDYERLGLDVYVHRKESE